MGGATFRYPTWKLTCYQKDWLHRYLRCRSAENDLLGYVTVLPEAMLTGIVHIAARVGV